jgi:hypothetical protein
MKQENGERPSAGSNSGEGLLIEVEDVSVARSDE